MFLLFIKNAKVRKQYLAIKLIQSPASNASPMFSWFKANNKLNPRPFAPIKAEITAIEKQTIIT